MNDHDSNDWILELCAFLSKTRDLAECDTSEEIRNIFHEWIEKLSSAVSERLRYITPSEALHIREMIDFALDAINDACEKKKLDPCATVALLYPLEDVVVSIGHCIARNCQKGAK